MLPGGAETVDYLGGHAGGSGQDRSRPERDTPKAAVPGAPGPPPSGGDGGGAGGAGKRNRRTGKGSRWADQAWEPAVHSAQLMFQPLRPLSGVIVLSGEFLTMTTSPMSELL